MVVPPACRVAGFVRRGQDGDRSLVVRGRAVGHRGADVRADDADQAGHVRHGEFLADDAMRPPGLAQEPYDLLLTADTAANDRLAPLWALLERADFRAEVEAPDGYSCAETGRRIR